MPFVSCSQTFHSFWMWIFSCLPTADLSLYYPERVRKDMVFHIFKLALHTGRKCKWGVPVNPHTVKPAGTSPDLCFPSLFSPSQDFAFRTQFRTERADPNPLIQINRKWHSSSLLEPLLTPQGSQAEPWAGENPPNPARTVQGEQRSAKHLLEAAKIKFAIPPFSCEV